MHCWPLLMGACLSHKNFILQFLNIESLENTLALTHLSMLVYFFSLVWDIWALFGPHYMPYFSLWGEGVIS